MSPCVRMCCGVSTCSLQRGQRPPTHTSSLHYWHSGTCFRPMRCSNWAEPDHWPALSWGTSNAEWRSRSVTEGGRLVSTSVQNQPGSRCLAVRRYGRRLPRVYGESAVGWGSLESDLVAPGSCQPHESVTNSSVQLGSLLGAAVPERRQGRLGVDTDRQRLAA